MPGIPCIVCGSRTEVPMSDIKLLDRRGVFVCGKDCIVTWLKEKTAAKESTRKRRALLEKLVRKGRCEVAKEQHPVKTYDFRSDYEYFFWDAMCMQGFHGEMEYEKYQFIWNRTRSYLPDFYFKSAAVFVEVKGKWGMGARGKLQEFRRKFPGLEVLVVPWVIREDFYTDGEAEGVVCS